MRALATALALALACTAHAAPGKLTPDALDALVDAALAKTGKTLPVEQTPELLLRRLAFDLTGEPPRAGEAHAARTDGAAGIAQWIERTEAGSAPRERLAERLAALLLGRRGRIEGSKFEDWLAEELGKDRRVLPLMSRIVTATGVFPDEGAGGWFVRFSGDPAELTTQLSRTMLGESMGCARCHDHPFSRWKRTEFLGLAAAFAQVGYVDQPDLGGQDRFRIWDRGWGDVYLDGSARPVRMALPSPVATSSVAPTGKVTSAIGSMGMMSLGMSPTTTGPEPEASPAEPPGPSRRERLGQWLKDPANPMPARALANRVWAWMMGRAVVTPVHDLTMGTDELPGVLDALAGHLAATGGDVLDLQSVIVRTRAYRARREDGGPFPARRLSLEELVSALARIAERPGMKADDRPESKAERLAERRGRLADLLEALGADDLSEANDPATIARGLFLLGGGPLADSAGRAETLAARIEKGDQPEAVAEWLFEATLSRAPRPAEVAWLVARLKADKDVQQVLGDALWAIYNSGEFGVLR